MGNREKGERKERKEKKAENRKGNRKGTIMRMKNMGKEGKKRESDTEGERGRETEDEAEGGGVLSLRQRGPELSSCHSYYSSSFYSFLTGTRSFLFPRRVRSLPHAGNGSVLFLVSAHSCAGACTSNFPSLSSFVFTFFFPALPRFLARLPPSLTQRNAGKHTLAACPDGGFGGTRLVCLQCYLLKLNISKDYPAQEIDRGHKQTDIH